MKKNLTVRETIAITSMLFGMFFGAGNLIFPAKLGIDAGSSLIMAYIGLFITAVGLPLLAVAALGISKCNGVYYLASKVNKKYGLFFSILLYLTIGPLFAIPRCASTSFSVGAVNLIKTENQGLALAIFSFVFFVLVLLFSLRPNGIMIWIGKILNPVFLCFLAVLIMAAVINPITGFTEVTPTENYSEQGKAFFNGFLEGYNTLDALAGLAFGIVIVSVVKKQGIEEPERVAMSTVKAGVFSCLFMGIIYFLITFVAAQSSSICGECADGGAVLGVMANYYFKSVGAILMTAIVTIACLKTAIGLVTSCSEAFVNMFPKGPTYTVWTVVFCLVSFGIANFGLSTIVSYCVPVLMFIYPLAMTLIILALIEKYFDGSHTVYIWTTGFTLFAALFDFINTLSSTLKGSGIQNTEILDKITVAVSKYLPFFEYGLGWICPAIIGFVMGFILYKIKEKKEIAA